LSPSAEGARPQRGREAATEKNKAPQRRQRAQRHAESIFFLCRSPESRAENAEQEKEKRNLSVFALKKMLKKGQEVTAK
jgi:hypothetical protein